MKKIKAFIINRDLVTWPKAMVEWMNNVPELEPVILDNASTYPPLLEWYETNPCRVVRLPSNFGHKVLWSSGIIYKEITADDDYFLLTDPDLDISTVPYDVIDKLKEAIHKYNLSKCGLAIRIDDMPDEYPLKEQVLIWETPFWNETHEENLYKSPIDTTFALHDAKQSRGHKIGGARLAGEYTLRHLPFYLTKNTVTEEFRYFCNHADSSSTQATYLREWVNKSLEKRNEE